MFAEKSIYFWPVGTGDSTTFVVRGNQTVFQVDLRHSCKSEDEKTDCVPIIDRLATYLPKVGGRPYLSAFAITHPDKDHIQGFGELLERVDVGELWFSPRIFREHDDDPGSLGEDARAFREEAHRRVQATIRANGDPGPGNRVRLIGWDDLLREPKYHGFPAQFFSVPGSVIESLDGQPLPGEFRAFVHAPFKPDESFGDRNDTSLALQVVFGNDPSSGGVLLFGDHKYPMLRKIFDYTRAGAGDVNLRWQVLLAPHHCSKSAMYEEEDGKSVLRQDILKDLEATQVGMGYVVASSNCVPASNDAGENPPHAKAKARYQEIARGGFLCTHDDGGHAEPLRFEVNGAEISYDANGSRGIRTGALAAAINDARGSRETPTTKVGFGWLR